MGYSLKKDGNSDSYANLDAAAAPHHGAYPVPSSDATHHVINGADGLPAYEEEAWHIHPDGRDAYARRFKRSFGFYDNVAAVVSRNGWHHITPTGDDLYPQRYDWCGNFQDRLCAVRESDGTYFHITLLGEPAYAGRWCYAGDFRHGIAVVQGDDGRSTHIDMHGSLVHGCWFIDLDVFHKRFARARDDAGWCHIDMRGAPLYAKRFATVEPFYNGQARCERFDGGLDVIDETGETITEIRPTQHSAFADLSSDLVSLGVFERLPASSATIAVDCELDPVRAPRLLRALGEMGLVTLEGGEWKATSKGEYLTSSSSLTLADAAAEYAGPLGDLWQELPRAMRAGGGWTADEIFTRIDDNDARRTPHHRMLQSYARHDYAGVAQLLGLEGQEHVIDAGGGFGTLGGLLLEAWPRLAVTVLDLPGVVEDARGNAPAGLGFRAGDLFKPWGIEADVVVMARVLHDWDDDHATQILRQARTTLVSGGRLFVIEMVLPDEGFGGGLCDLHLLVATGGQERGLDEYRTLLAGAGFALDEVRRSGQFARVDSPAISSTPSMDCT